MSVFWGCLSESEGRASDSFSLIRFRRLVLVLRVFRGKSDHKEHRKFAKDTFTKDTKVSLILVLTGYCLMKLLHEITS